MLETRVSVSGHFGEWLQGRYGPDGPVALVTMPCPALRVTTPGDAPALFPQTELCRFADALGIAPHFPGTARALPVGAGAGASTATLVALARAAGFEGTAEALARACLAIEGASDPLMFDQPDTLLWASREGRVLRQLPAIPACEIVGGFFGPAVRTDAQDSDYDDIRDLVDAWAEAAARSDLGRLAALASASARRCTRRRGPTGDPTADLARELGALGWQRAHTGSARGLIFAPGTVPAHAEAMLTAAGLRHVLHFGTGGA